MNLNQCPSGIRHKAKIRKKQIGIFFIYFYFSQVAFQTLKGVPNFADTMMSVAIFANCHRRGLRQSSEKIQCQRRCAQLARPELLCLPTRSFINLSIYLICTALTTSTGRTIFSATVVHFNLLNRYLDLSKWFTCGIFWNKILFCF